ncbi:MAG TPA: hypothetical protein VNL14_19755 [Candidatus Acidoferrales bacterium]|nr:hypothetical protein [Candidatus Acidoferrales bacterium]
MKLARLLFAAFLMAGSLAASAASLRAEEESDGSWQTRVREMRKFKYEHAQD